MLLAARLGTAALVTLALLARGVVSRTAGAAAPRAGSPPPKGDGQPTKPAPSRLGLVVHEPGAYQGYTLVFPFGSTRTYLIDMQGKVVRTWLSKYTPGEEAYLLDNGHLLRPAKLSDSEAIFTGAGPGGRIQEFTWEGTAVWDFKFHNERQIQHHGITRMPNGNIMMIVWERKTPEELAEAGVKPVVFSRGDMLVDSLIEISPAGKTGGKIVWEWHLWDHLIQDHDASKANYGDVAADPERVDVNFWDATLEYNDLVSAMTPTPKKDAAKKDPAKKDVAKRDTADKLRGIGYIGAVGNTKKSLGFIRDWTHVNSVSYHPKLDQLMLSSREFSEIWIIDHGTTTAEAKGRSGGRYGKGGDLLYRWGNPRTYRASAAAQQLFYQHDAQWIPEGLPGAGHLLVFNNGPRPTGPYSSVDEVVLPVGPGGRYEHAPGKAYGPMQPLWSYTAPCKADFFGWFMSGVQRLPNGNTLISTGFSGSIFEVTREKELVWKFVVPSDAPPKASPPGDPPRPVHLLPGLLPFFVRLDPAQWKQVEAFEKEASASLEKLLTAEQKRQLSDLKNGFDPGGPGVPTEAGQVMPWAVQERLHLTADQREHVADLQKEVTAKYDALLTKEQKRQARESQGFANFLRVLGGTGGNAVFRAYRYGLDFPGLAGKDLTPGMTIDELASKPVESKRLSK